MIADLDCSLLQYASRRSITFAAISSMSDSVTTTIRYSTIASFELVCDGRSYRVAQVASDFIIFAQPQSLPAGEADPYIRVEQGELHRRIRLPRGASDTDPIVPIERL